MSLPKTMLDAPGLAISCYCSDPVVLDILKNAFASQERFTVVIVVDSLGDSSLTAAIELEG